MARNGDTKIVYNDDYFDSVLRSPKVEALVDKAGDQVQAIARSTAPVDTEAYRDGIRKEVKQAKHRRVVRVVASDEKSLIIESKTGNLARALKAAKIK